MSEVIYKYTLQRVTSILFYAELPKNAKIINIGNQNNSLVIWAICDPNDKERFELKKYYYNIYFTGQIKDKFEGTYIKTLVLYGDELVIHIFKVEDDSKYKYYEN